MKLYCGFSTTPGEILWFISSTILTTNDSFLITQRLLHSTPNVLYEGVLDIVDYGYRSQGLFLRCVIHNTIIDKDLYPTPSSVTITSRYSVTNTLCMYICTRDCIYKTFCSTARHYFVLSFIGQSQSITCSFPIGFETVQSTEIHSDEGILDSKPGKTITFDIGKTTDTIHNKEYACIGVTSDGNDFFENITIVALSKF